MKRLISVLLLAVMIFSLTGCENKTNDDKKDIIVYPDSSAKSTLGGYKTESVPTDNQKPTGQVYYVVNASSKKFHLSTCHYAKTMKPENRKNSTDRQLLIENGYSPCGSCKP